MKNKYSYVNCYNTKTVCLDFKRFCVYCGKELTEPSGIIDGMSYTDEYYHCDCINANKEKELKIKISKVEYELRNLKDLLPKPIYGIKQTFGIL